MKLCKDCKYFYDYRWCRAPQNGMSPVDGEPQVDSAISMRSRKSDCGPEANFFVPLDPKPWWRLW